MTVTSSTSPANSPSTREASRFEMPAPLRADVRLLGELLGTVLREYGGPELLHSVERLRELTIAAHHDDPDTSEEAARRAEQLVETWPTEVAENVARAFTCYFHLSNLAEEYHRVRTLRQRDVEGAPESGSLAAAYSRVVEASGAAVAEDLLANLEFRPVLTAHPTEARRRAVSSAIRRISMLLAERDDPRLGDHARQENRRQLLEQIDVLWRTAQIRKTRPGPLDEVRAAVTVFEDSLFDVLPRVYRRLDDAIRAESAEVAESVESADSAKNDRSADAGAVAHPTAGAPIVPAFVRLGSWIGGDRDGNPNVTAAVTGKAVAIQADHVLGALTRACRRLGAALTLDAETTPPSPDVRRLLDDARTTHPERVADIEARSPNESHRQLVLLAAERLAATRRRDADLAYAGASELLAELYAVRRSLGDAGAHRQAYGQLQHLIWQVETFGFHLAELEVRQHSEVHARALAELRERPAASVEPLSEQTEEVLAVFRVIAATQQRFGAQACRRYVVSFTRTAEDLAAVYELADYALGDRAIELDVVPLFETEDDLSRSVDIVADAVRMTALRDRLAANGHRLEVMLGYSDSAKDAGPVSATLALYDAQARLTAWAREEGVRLTLFHGRGGALGRGGGPANRAVLAQAPGSVAGRFKLTEQGEVIFARYGDPTIARRHVEQVSAATLLASTPAVEARVAESASTYAELAQNMDAAARAAYHGLVRTPGFAEWFARVTPAEEIGSLPLGSRPAKRGLQASSLEDLRAIPWVFAWSQARINLTGWYGVGAGLAAVGDIEALRRAYAEWPLFAVMIDNVEMSLAKTDSGIARRYLELGDRPDLTERVLSEYAQTKRWVLTVLGQEQLLENSRVLGRAVELRNPYVDALSYIQLHAFRRLRSGAANADPQLRDLVLLTVGGVAAGLQNTG